jgi:mannose-6-phosphate isomerase-like protein (cupin superfamily)
MVDEHAKNQAFRRLALMKQLLSLLVLVPMFAADPPGFVVWKGSDLKSFDKTLASKLDDRKAAMEEFSKVGDFQTLIVHREGDGEAELHERDAVVLIIESGEATLVAGGNIVDPRTIAPGEIRSASIQGGESKAVTGGDVVLIPANLPHQVLVAEGQRVTYLAIRQQRKDAAPADATLSALPVSRPAGKKPVLGIDLGAGFRACIAGDDSPSGTIVDGYRKATSRSFMGQSCLWESIRPQEKVMTGSASGKEQPRLGIDVGEGYRSCVPGDNSPSGTIVDGYRKVSNSSPFGVSCGWERIK